MLRSEAFSLPSYDIEEWEVRVTNDVLGWIRKLDDRSRAQVIDAIDRLAEAGPGLGRPLVDRIEGAEENQ